LVKIFIEKPIAPDELCGNINPEGLVYCTSSDGQKYLGWVDYEKGDVYDAQDRLIGWADDAGAIVAYYQETDEELEVGYITDDGEIFYYDEDEKEIYFGRLRKWEYYAEGAATLLLFMD
jgi:hypothetical protein